MTWAVIVLAALGTFAARVAFVGLGERWAPPDWLETRLDLLAPAAAGALVTFSVAVSVDAVVVPPVRHLVAVVAAFVLVRRTGNLLLALAVGLALVVVFS